ncbi:MAG TPA: Hpt domain-containing protein, partial [Methylovirgula sp.]
MDDLLSDFLIETSEQIDAAGEQLVLFERDPSDREAIIRIFRLFHTIKGTCGFLSLSRLELLTHVTESLISKLRDGAPATSETVSLILTAVDRVKTILANLTDVGKEPDGDDRDLIAALESDASATSRAPENAPLTAQPKTDAGANKNPSPRTMPSSRADSIRVSVGALERIMILVSELVLTRNQLLEITRHQEDAIIKTQLQRLSGLKSDLQDAVMSARM